MNNVDIKGCGIQCLSDEAQALLDLIPLIDDSFEQAVRLIYNAKGRTIVTGVGKSGHIGAKIAATLASTGTPSFYVNPLDAYHGDLGMFTPEDVVIAISYSGNTDELLRFLPILLDRQIPIIGISGNPQSLLARYSTHHLNVNVRHEACPLNLAPTSSTTATIAMGDAIACALMQLRDFKAEDFARFHPGGSLGRRLIAKVRDVMRKDDLPRVLPADKISDALLIISNAKLGLAVMVDPDDRVTGIITDGDIRRAMSVHRNDIFNMAVSDVANTSPITITQDARLTDAEDIIFGNKIHVLIVTDSERHLVGVIDAITCVPR